MDIIKALLVGLFYFSLYFGWIPLVYLLAYLITSEFTWVYYPNISVSVAFSAVSLLAFSTEAVRFIKTLGIK